MLVVEASGARRSTWKSGQSSAYSLFHWLSPSCARAEHWRSSYFWWCGITRVLAQHRGQRRYSTALFASWQRDGRLGATPL